MGNSWYDALQTKVTKRYSHGLDLLATFTWQKELTTAEGTAVNDVFNRPIQKAISAQSQPLVFVTAFSYEVPKFGPNVVRQVLGGWTVGSMLRYASGLPIPVPTANNNIGTVLPRNSGTTFCKSRTRAAVVPAGSELPLLRPDPHVRPQSGSLGRSSSGPVRRLSSFL